MIILKRKLFIKILVLIILITAVGCSNRKKHPSPNNSLISEKVETKGKHKPVPNTRDFSSFKELNLEKDNIKLGFEGKVLDLVLPVYIEKNRYYLPLTELVEKIGGTSKIEENILSLELNNNLIKVDVKANTFSQGDKTQKLKRHIIFSNDFCYISLIDLCRIFNLKADWNTDNKTISLFNNRDKLEVTESPASEKTALLRLEDITAGQRYSNSETLEKLRIISDYLYSQNIPFHVAWVPRYIDPTKNPIVDNDPSKQNNMFNSDFVFTLDYFEERNGIIGLHGYTHQFDNTVSIDANEFHRSPKDRIPSTDAYTQERINLAIASAKALDIPYGFFEAPHYAAAPNVLRVLEKNFDYLYQPYSPDGFSESKKLVVKKLGDRTIKYIPTPLDYVDGKNDTDKMIKKINTLAPDLLASFFYHPSIEFEDIKLSKDNTGYPSYTYSPDSTLHRIIKASKDKGYKFKTINEVH
jgi:hypothetical protein